ncbi:exo-beta-N-acetylmuramidase NamZ domain-containing protein [Haloferula sp. BvORR071]|uniref:exo-beta-N-acetylmuramidase NamZ domain-containing protein n=1 Tax=Haloferula sp. BvORR071 TaxID=1396141 RepID=UPI000A7D5766|nr:exo-beta-N-acetylmuramidase NamZ domain-containing protein [Haloferula sp. BvORR071]
MPFREDRLRAIDDAIQQAITDARTPGAVFRLEREGVVYQRAYGSRAIVPEREPMSEDTIFDAASLTKVIATTSAVMKLVEAGKLDPEAPASRYLPEFGTLGKERITLRHLLTHSSGLRAGLSPNGDWKGKEEALKRVCQEAPTKDPGTSYLYSDINFITLGFIVERVSGKTLDAFCAEEIFQPLGMKDSGFRPFDPKVNPLPQPADTGRIAPTEMIGKVVLRGVVHDPTSRRMGGVAGHAGLFLTVEDLGRFARMLLGGGELDGVRIFRPETVEAMTHIQSPEGLPRRGFGWDIDSPHAGPRGEIFPIGSYGHTGWTGTRLWIDPFSKTSVIFLSNRNHPDEKGGVVKLQGQLGTLAAEAIPDFNFQHVPGALEAEPAKAVAAKPPAPSGPVLNGIDVLKREDFRQLRGCKVGLITNQTGIDRERNTTIDLLQKAPGLKLVALFSPEHGIRGDLDREGIGDTTDEKTGLPVCSLYGERRSPTAEQLAGIDTLVFDIQDIGCRFYTYISTMTNCMEAAGRAKLRFVVLDRVNPIGPIVEGPVLSAERSFVAAHEIPLRHGMTVGELARMIDAERKFGAQPEVIRCEGGPALQWFDGSGQPWQNPSPNMRGPTAAILYPGVGMLEFCKLSVGRGTDTPFELLGAPYIDELRFAADLNQVGLPGVRFVPTRFTPVASVFKDLECRGVRILLTDRESFRAADLGMVLAATLQRLYGDKVELGKMAKLIGDPATLDALIQQQAPDAIRKLRDRGVADFLTRRKPFLLYPR